MSSVQMSSRALPISYWRRRQLLWREDKSSLENAQWQSLVSCQSVLTLPVTRQMQFRVKLLAGIVLQKLFLWVLVMVGSFLPAFQRRFDTFFRPHDQQEKDRIALNGLLTCLGMGLLCLLLTMVLFAVRDKSPFNIAVLSLVLMTQSGFEIAIGNIFDARVAYLNCSFALGVAFAMLLLSIVTLSDKKTTQKRLLRPVQMGCYAFGFNLLGYIMLFGVLGREMTSLQGFLFIVLAQLMATSWLVYDTCCMLQVLYEWEWLCGMVYIHSDLLLMVANALALMAHLCGVDQRRDLCCCQSDAFFACLESGCARKNSSSSSLRSSQATRTRNRPRFKNELRAHSFICIEEDDIVVETDGNITNDTTISVHGRLSQDIDLDYYLDAEVAANTANNATTASP